MWGQLAPPTGRGGQFELRYLQGELFAERRFFEKSSAGKSALSDLVEISRTDKNINKTKGNWVMMEPSATGTEG